MDWWQPFVLTLVVALKSEESAQKPLPPPPQPPQKTIYQTLNVPDTAL